MATDRKLIQYLPHFVQEYFEMQKVMESEQPEIDLLWTALENMFADQFIQDATENGISRWESMLKITPKATDTLDERKFKILTKLNQELPYTMRKLIQTLTTLCGADGFLIDLNANEYYIEVQLALSNENNYAEVERTLQKMVPANMKRYVKIMYNSHGILSQFTHGQLTAYTHNQLRREVFD